MKIKIDVDAKTFVRFWLVSVAFGLGLFAIYSARTALILVLTSIFLALALNYPVNKLAKLMPGSGRLLGTLGAYVLIVVIITLAIKIVTPPLVDQTTTLVNNMPKIIDENQQNIQMVGKFIKDNNLQPKIDDAVEKTKRQAENWLTGSFASDVMDSISAIGTLLASMFIVLVMTFLMLLESPKWIDAFWSTYRNQEKLKHHKALSHKMYEAIKGYVNGQILVAIVAGIASGITVLILSLCFEKVSMSLALPAAALSTMMSLIPMFGAMIAGAIITLLLALSSLPAAIIFLVYFIVYQQVEGNFISPLIQSKTVSLSALVVMVSVTIGTFTLGLIGAVISIPIAAWVKILVEDYLENRPPVDGKNKNSHRKLIPKISKS